MLASECVAGSITRRARKPRVQRKPLSLFQFLARSGGLRACGDLRVILDDRRGTFVPGFGALVRRHGRGLSLDHARALCVEASYLFDAGDITGGLAESTTRDLLDLIDAEARGDRQYAYGVHIAPEADECPETEKQTPEIGEGEAADWDREYDPDYGQDAPTLADDDAVPFDAEPTAVAEPVKVAPIRLAPRKPLGRPHSGRPVPGCQTPAPCRRASHAPRLRPGRVVSRGREPPGRSARGPRGRPVFRALQNSGRRAAIAKGMIDKAIPEHTGRPGAAWRPSPVSGA